ncbi:translation initiation factor IF-2 [Aequorivita sp. Q41]|uniref:translation initiation factor IF-2 n=1 Tax=Aequorivita sp. Q41 TaxID=3153300 RepID=UPI003242EB60
MAEEKSIRLNKVLREFNISLDRAVEFLKDHGHEIDARPTTKISNKEYEILFEEFETDKSKKVASKEVGEEKRKEKEELRLEREREIEEKQKKEESSRVIKAEAKLEGPKQVGKIDLEAGKAKKEAPKAEEKPVEVVAEKKENKEEQKEEKVETPEVVAESPKVAIKEESKPEAVAPVEEVKAEKEEKVTEKPKEIPVEKKETEKVVAEKTSEETKEEALKQSDTVTTQYRKLEGPNFTGQKIDLTQFKKPEKKKDPKADDKKDKKGKRRRISKEAPKNGASGGGNNFKDNRGGGGARKGRTNTPKEEPSEEEVQKQVRETLEKLQGKSSKGKGAKYRREKRDTHRQKSDELAQQEADSKLIKVTEFVTANEMATMMDVPVTKIISACMSLGMMVTMNQRLDAETLSIVAEEFGYELEFVTADIEESIDREIDAPEDLEPRAPIVTVMGHVDHGKTSLLDYIRKENVIAGESGGITQHIGAYGVELDNGQKIAFLDTPGHEAFTAMRARGAQVTDLAIIVVAADDAIMPQTKEAISHAQAAGVPIVFAINKIDKPNANPDKIKEGLASMNLLVEDWGGKIQSHDISAKTGDGVKELLEKVLLEAELLELTANPNRQANGTVVEAFLDKGRGYVSTVLVQGGTLKVGDYVLAGQHSGKVKAMQDERGNSIKAAGPSTPVSVLGLDGAPQAGDKFNVFEDEREAKAIATKRTQLQREQSVRTQRHITLDEIGRRIALGDFKELNIILKGDVDGSVEALTDSLLKLSTEEIQVNIIHKAVGPITESDVLLASASDAIIIGFNVRPMGNARQIADKEEIDIRTYSIIYDAINDVKDAMEGMLSPEMKEEITGTAEIRETFKISKVGTIAGCMVLTGKIFRNSGIRLIREGVVVYTGELASLKRFKDDVKEVAKGYDCGIQVKNYNDIYENDIIEAFQEVEIKKKLK